MKAFLLPALLALSVGATAQVGLGTTAPHAPLQFGNTTDSRKIVLYETGNNDHQFYGIGVDAATLRYQVDVSQSDHVFYSGTGASFSRELMRIKGTGTVGIGTSTPDTSAVLDVSSGSKAFIVPRLTAQAISAITAPTGGMIVYNVDSAAFWGCTGRLLNPLISQVATGASIVSVSTSGSFGQSFLYNSSYKLSAIDVDVFVSGTTDLELKVRLGTGFGGAILATSSQASASGANGTMVRFTFPMPVALQAGIDYTFQISKTGASPNGTISAYINFLNPYLDGKYINTSSVGSSSSDLRFVIYGTNQRWQAVTQP